MRCKKCEEFYQKYPLIKDKNGKMGHKISENFIMSPIKCYFDNNGKNWWCETINSLRNIFDS